MKKKQKFSVFFFARRCEIEMGMKKKKNALSRAFKKLILEKLLRRCVIRGDVDELGWCALGNARRSN